MSTPTPTRRTPEPGWFDEVIATVDHMAQPTAERVLDTIKRLGS